LTFTAASQPVQGSQFTSPGASTGANTTGGHNAAALARLKGKVYLTNFYRIAWKDTLQHAEDLYPDAKEILAALHKRIQSKAVQQPDNLQGIQTFTVAAREDLTKTLGQRAQAPIEFFVERLKMVQRSGGNPDGQHTNRQNVQDVNAALQQQQAHAHAQQQQAQAQQQRQQQFTVQQQYAQQQYAQAQAQRTPQQYYQQQHLMAHPQQNQNPPVIQQLYNPPNTAGMYAHQQQPGMMMNPVVTGGTAAMAGANPQMQQYAAGTNSMTAAQQQPLGQQQRQFQAGSPVPPAAVATGPNPQGGKPPKAPKAGKRAAESEAGGAGAGNDGEGKPAPKRTKAAAAPRKKKAQESDADEDVADKIKVGDELLVDLQAETDAAMEGIGNGRARQLPTVPGGQSWDDGYQYLSAWRLTNEVLQQRKEKMQGAAAVSGSAGIVDFLEPSTLRALQLGFTAHAAEVMRRAAHAAKHRASSAAAQRRPEFVAVGEDARRGLGDIRRAAEKIAADKAALEREELMKKAQSKRADEETRERAQKARAEMAGQQQASAANKAIAATLGGGKGAKWSKWSGAGAAGAGGARKAKGKGVKGDAAADKASADGGDGGVDVEGSSGGLKNVAASRSRGDLGAAAGHGADNNVGSLGVGSSAADASGLESTDIQLQDLIVVLQQDPTYCKSMLLYRLLNGVN